MDGRATVIYEDQVGKELPLLDGEKYFDVPKGSTISAKVTLDSDLFTESVIPIVVQHCDQEYCKAQSKPVDMPYIKDDGKHYWNYTECSCSDGKCSCYIVEEELPRPSPGISADVEALSIKPGETKNITFTVTNEGADSDVESYLSVSVSPGLDIAVYRSSSDEMVFKNSIIGSQIWNSDGRKMNSTHELLDAYKAYASGESNTITVTIEPSDDEAAEAGPQWIRYRAAFDTIGEGKDYVRDPTSGPVDQQRWPVYEIPVTVTSDEIVKIVPEFTYLAGRNAKGEEAPWRHSMTLYPPEGPALYSLPTPIITADVYYKHNISIGSTSKSKRSLVTLKVWQEDSENECFSASEEKILGCALREKGYCYECFGGCRSNSNGLHLQINLPEDAPNGWYDAQIDLYYTTTGPDGWKLADSVSIDKAFNITDDIRADKTRPSPKVSADVESLSIKPGETGDVAFTVTDEGADSDIESYISVSVSPGLHIKEYKCSSDEMRFKHSQVGSKIWTSDNLEMNSEHELLDAYEAYSLGESNTITITVEPTGDETAEAGQQWIRYRAAFDTIGDGHDFVRDPISGPVDQQGWPVYEISVNSLPKNIKINAEIVEPIFWPKGSYQSGDWVDVHYTIKNTGTENHKFCMGASVRGPDDDDWIDLRYSETRELEPGEEILDMFTWLVPASALEGYYDVTIAVWEGKTPDGEKLVGELDRETREDQFQIESREPVGGDVNAEIVDPIFWPKGSYLPGDWVGVQYTIKNTGTQNHKFCMGASVRGPDDDWIDLPYSETRELEPGEEILDMFTWLVPSSALEGYYDVTIAVWENRNYEDGTLYGELDRRTKDNQFSIVIDVENHPPKLSDPMVSPEELWPENLVDLTYSVVYEDEDGDEPTQIWVNLGEESSGDNAFDMVLAEVYNLGAYYKARYEVTVTPNQYQDLLSAGQNFFNIYCSDGEDFGQTPIVALPHIFEDSSEKYPDLYISSDDIGFSRQNIPIGETVTITARIRNRGDIGTGDQPIIIEFWDGYPGLEGSVLLGKKSVPFLNEAESRNVEIESKWTLYPGNREIYVRLDGDDLINEGKEENEENIAFNILTIECYPRDPKNSCTPRPKKALILDPFNSESSKSYCDDLYSRLIDMGFNPEDIVYKKDCDVKIDLLDEWLDDEYGLIHISTHGSSDLVAIESYDDATSRDSAYNSLKNIYIDKGYTEDQVELMLGKTGTSTNKFVIYINHIFIRARCGPQPAYPLIFFEGCNIGNDDNMAEAFKCKGAGAYVGYDNRVSFITDDLWDLVYHLIGIVDTYDGTNKFYDKIFEGYNVEQSYEGISVDTDFPYLSPKAHLKFNGDGNLILNFDKLNREISALRWDTNGHYYELVKNDMNWEEANQYADAQQFVEPNTMQRYKGHLATITSPEEHDWIFGNLVSPIIAEGNAIWLGGYQKDGYEGKLSEGWCWVTGEPWSWTHWSGSEPNDCRGDNERFLEMWSWNGGYWNDEIIKWSFTYYLLIEYEPDTT